jgi:hypothetical protein
MAITSKGQGKSGGSRIITYVQVLDCDKSQLEDITKEQILELLKKAGLND